MVIALFLVRTSWWQENYQAIWKYRIELILAIISISVATKEFFLVVNTERYSLFFFIQLEYGKIRARKNSVFGHFSWLDFSCLLFYEVTLVRKCIKPVSEKVNSRFQTKICFWRNLFDAINKKRRCFEYRSENFWTVNFEEILHLKCY